MLDKLFYYLIVHSIDCYLALPSDEANDHSSLDKKTLKMIRLGELLHEYSSNSRLIVL